MLELGIWYVADPSDSVLLFSGRFCVICWQLWLQRSEDRKTTAARVNPNARGRLSEASRAQHQEGSSLRPSRC
ncbi:MAG: hypothetical protein DMF11_12755 [Verrucomicrobia bacterium]|nr:MAG: hypothetical protein DMF11_12755 [Verrucomicrobiota bacterium]